MGRGRGRTGSGMNGAPYGRSPGGGSTGGWGEYGPGPGRPSGPTMGMARNGQEKVEYQFLVPSTKTGIIIGKGWQMINRLLSVKCRTNVSFSILCVLQEVKPSSRSISNRERFVNWTVDRLLIHRKRFSSFAVRTIKSSWPRG